MASYNDTVLTSNGIAILNRVLAGQCTVTFTRAVSSIADYSGKTLSELQALTSLDSIEQNGIATRFDVRSKSMVSIDLLFTNKDLQNSYEIKTIGLYAKASDSSTEVLYAIATAADPETMPAYVDHKLTKFTLTLYTKVGQADKTSITITDEGVVKSINGTIKPDANGNITMSYYSQADVDQKVSSLSSRIDSLNSTKTNNTDFEAIKNRVSAVEFGKADKTSVYDKETSDSLFVNAAGDSMTGDLVLDSSHHLEHLGGVVSFSTSFEQQSSINSLINVLRSLTGCSGSFYLTVQDGNLNAGWYNFVWMPHREGGIKGGDNSDYGTMLLVPFFDDSAWIIKYSNGATSTKALAWDGDITSTKAIANATKDKAEANANSIKALSDETARAISRIDSLNSAKTDNTDFEAVKNRVSAVELGKADKTNVYDKETSDSLFVNAAGDSMTGDLVLDSSHHLEHLGGVVSFSTSFEQQSSINSLINVLRSLTGCSGSFYLTVQDGNLNAGWYNFVWMPHREGGIKGGDNSDYGTMLLVPFFDDSAWIIKYSNGATSTKALAWNDDITSTKAIANAAKEKAEANANSIKALSDETTRDISSLDAKMPQAAYVPTVLTTDTDLNSMKTCGFYMLQGGTSNSPVDGWVYVKVLGIPTRLTQFAWQDIDPAQQWCRWYDGSNWTPWTHYTKAL